MLKKNTAKKRGTDEAFLQLMSICGAGILKLLGVAPEEAEKYRFRATVLKEKRVEPDVEGLPVLEGGGRKAFIEFSGYYDKFIRYKIAAKAFLGCARDQYQGEVIAAIIYTDENYKKNAAPLAPFMEKEKCCLTECLTEIVLTDYTEEQLVKTDPRLIILAPFTLSRKVEKTSLKSKGRKWKESLTNAFPLPQHQDALNVLSLLLLNRFHNISHEEVVAMMNFDLLDTRAGQDIYNIGALDTARAAVVENLAERFEIVPESIIEKINKIDRKDILLRVLLRKAVRCKDMDGFSETLTKALQ